METNTIKKAKAFADRRIEELKAEVPEVSGESDEFFAFLRSFYVEGFADGHSEAVSEMRESLTGIPEDDGKEIHHSTDLDGRDFSATH